MRWTVCLSVLTLTTACLALSAQDGDAKKDKAQMQGTWAMVGATKGGKDMPIPDGMGITLIFKGDKVTKMEPGSPDDEANYTIDPTKNPKHIDFKVKKETSLGIYELKGDTLKLGWSIKGPNDNRPTAFNNEGLVMTFKKKKV